MRIQGRALGVFVPGLYTVPEMPVLGTDWSPVTWQGVAGLADFVGGKFAVPQNPILDAGLAGLADFVGGKFAVPQNPILDAGIGDLVGTQAMYPILPNTVTAAAQAQGLTGLASGADCGCGCQGHGSCGSGMSGLGDISTWLSTQWTAIQSGNLETIALWGGGALLVAMVLFGGAKRRSRRS